MKQGGKSWNTSPKGKKGIQTRFKCAVCGREYKQEHTRNAHQTGCETYNERN